MDEWIRDSRIVDGIKKDFYFKIVEIEPWWNDDGQQLVHQAVIWKDGLVPPPPTKLQEFMFCIVFGLIVVAIFILVTLLLGMMCDVIYG